MHASEMVCAQSCTYKEFEELGALECHGLKLGVGNCSEEEPWAAVRVVTWQSLWTILRYNILEPLLL